MKIIKRIVKDLLLLALFVLLFNMFFSGRDQAFSFSLMIASGIYCWILFFRFIFFLIGIGSSIKGSDTNKQFRNNKQNNKQNNNSHTKNIATSIYYDDILFHDKHPHHHDHFND